MGRTLVRGLSDTSSGLHGETDGAEGRALTGEAATAQAGALPVLHLKRAGSALRVRSAPPSSSTSCRALDARVKAALRAAADSEMGPAIRSQIPLKRGLNDTDSGVVPGTN